MGIQNQPNRLPPSRQTTVQHRIIRQYRSHSRHNGHMAVPVLVHPNPGRIACNPFGVSCPGSDLPIQSHGIFHRHIGSLRPDIMKKYFIYPITFFLQNSFCHRNSLFPENPHPLSCYKRIRIQRANDYSGNMMLQYRFRTGRSLPIVATGLQRHIESGSCHRYLTRRQGVPLRMKAAEPLMPSLANDRSVFDDDRSHHRIGIHPACSLLCQSKRPFHKKYVFFHLYPPDSAKP